MGHLITFITIILASLKLTGYIAVSWLVVFTPLLISIAVAIVFFIIAALILVVME